MRNERLKIITQRFKYHAVHTRESWEPVHIPASCKHFSSKASMSGLLNDVGGFCGGCTITIREPDTPQVSKLCMKVWDSRGEP